MHQGKDAPRALEDAAEHLRQGMGPARRGRESLVELRRKERHLLREWAAAHGYLLARDPTLNLNRRSSHGEHTVAFDPEINRWWKVTHPGTAGIGAEFKYRLLPPFSVVGVLGRELLPSEYFDRMILHNNEFGDDVRLAGYLDEDRDRPSLVVSQPHIEGQPATAKQMTEQMEALGYSSLECLQIGRANSISFYHPERRIALFDAHPGNFFHSAGLTLPVDGIISRIDAEAEHSWLMNRIESSRP